MSIIKKLFLKLGYRTHRDRPDPTNNDLKKWEKAESDLMDHLYTGLTGLFQKMGHKRIHKLTDKYKDLKVLEIGCGHAHHLEFSTKQYKNYTGLDISNELLEEAKKRYPYIKTVLANAEDMPFADDSFDIVLSIYNLEHIRNLDNLLKEVKRVLKSDGRFIVGLPMEGGLLYNLGREYSSKPYMEKKYALDYGAIIKHEHCNEIWDIMIKIKDKFIINKSNYLPFEIKNIHLNIIGVFELINK